MSDQLIVDQIEPGAKRAWTHSSIPTAASISQAISLKRIADALEKLAVEFSDDRPKAPEYSAWTDWNGGTAPEFPPATLVMLRCRSGMESIAPVPIPDINWSHTGNGGDVVAFKVLM